MAPASQLQIWAEDPAVGPELREDRAFVCAGGADEPRNPSLEPAPPEGEHAGAGECGWSEHVALDPRHRPQTLDRPASTVRREWCRAPQEAHLLDPLQGRYRKLTWEEIAMLQGFDPDWFRVPRLTKSDRIRAIGDAVPPPVAAALFDAIDHAWEWGNQTVVELCAGAGGLASGAAGRLDHRLLLDRWEPACRILRQEKPWSPGAVVQADAARYEWSSLRGNVGLLSGGPPCQPWSHAGRRSGIADPRDLLASIHQIIAAVQPEVFLFENVPGLAGLDQQRYLRTILDRLRQPADEQAYGVMAGVINAADFGVPQTRRRLFFIGFRDKPAAFAYRVLDAVAEMASHRDPNRADDRPRWVTVGDAVAGRPDPGGWRQWVRPGTVAVEAA
jgi:site-specific DNA-cytosine methylase